MNEFCNVIQRQGQEEAAVASGMLRLLISDRKWARVAQGNGTQVFSVLSLYQHIAVTAS